MSKQHGRSRWRELDGGFESLVRFFEIVAAPIDGAESRVGFGRFRVQIDSSFEFALPARLFVLPEIERGQRQMITGAVLIFFPHALNAFSGVFNFVWGLRGIGEQQEGWSVVRLFL